MEKIKKKINLRRYMSCSPGITPYIPFNKEIDGVYFLTGSTFNSASTNGNYYSFPANISVNDDDKYEMYRKVYDKFNYIKNLIHSSLKLKFKEYKDGKEIFIDNYSERTPLYEDTYNNETKFCYYIQKDYLTKEECFYVNNNENIIDNTGISNYVVVIEEWDKFCEILGNDNQMTYYYRMLNKMGVLWVNSFIEGSAVPEYLYKIKVSDYLDNLNRHKKDKVCCGESLYEELGGDKMWNFLMDNKSYTWGRQLSLSDRKLIPTLEIPILLNQNFDDFGLYSIYEDSEGDLDVSRNFSGETYNIESELTSLRVKEKIYGDSEELPYILVNDEPHIPYMTYKGTGNAIDPNYIYNEKLCYDGIDAQYNYCDYIETIISDTTSVTFNYVLNGIVKKVYNISTETYEYVELLENKGLHCQEKYNLHYETIGGKNIPIIDYDNNKQTIYNKVLKKHIYVNFATVINDYSHDYRTDDMDNVIASNHLVYRNEYLNGVVMNPKIDVNVSISRGSGSAFEKHLKLGECNSMEDLENYGNNIFNL